MKYLSLTEAHDALASVKTSKVAARVSEASATTRDHDRTFPRAAQTQESTWRTP